MHRSGTSACTRVLNLLGCALPDEVWGAAIGNEKGHWESIAAQQLDDDILASAGSSWSDWGPINPDWRSSNIRAEMTSKAAQVIADHAKLGPLFALKDPRICRLADVWLDAMQKARVEPLVLIMLRNPGEVAESLENRDLMSTGYGSLLWLRHALDAEYLSRGTRRVHCTYDELLTDWYDLIGKIKAGLGVSFPRNSPTVHAEIDAFLSLSDRHHQKPETAVGRDSASSDWIRNAWAIFLGWSKRGENPADHKTLDEIRTEFDRSYGTFARLLITPEMSGAFGAAGSLREQLTSTISEAQEAAARADEAMRAADAKLRENAEREETLKRQHEEGMQRLRELEAEAQALREREPSLTAEIETLQKSLDDAGEQVSALEAEVAELAAEAKRISELETEIEALRSRKDELTSEIADLEKRCLNAGAETEAERRHREQAEELLRQVERELHKAGQKVADYQDQLAVAQSTLAQRAEEVAQISVELINTAKAASEAEASRANEHELRLATQRQLDDTQEALVQKAEEIAQLSEELINTSKTASEAEGGRVKEHELRLDTERRLEDANEVVAELRSHLQANQHEAAIASKKLGSEITLMTRLLRDESEALTSARGELATVTSQLQHVQRESADIQVQLRQVEQAAQTAGRARAELEQKLAQHHNETARLTTMLVAESQLQRQSQDRAESAEHSLAILRSEMTALAEKALRLEDKSRRTDGLHRMAEQRLASHLNENARLVTKANAEASRAEKAERKALWLRDLAQASQRMPKWWALMPQSWQRERQYRRHRRANLFDRDQYIRNNPDVAEAGLDPLTHFILHGLDEGRSWEDEG